MNTRTRIFVALLLTAVLLGAVLSGCGQKGELYHPDGGAAYDGRR